MPQDKSGFGEALLIPIEPFVRQEKAPEDVELVIRGGPLMAEKLLEHAIRQSREFSLYGRPMASISVDVTSPDWRLEEILSQRLWSRSTYAACQYRKLADAGYVLLPTHAAPHFDIVLPKEDLGSATALLAILGEPVQNPYRRRR